MAQFECAVPFKTGETWCRRNFFSADMKPIGVNMRVISLSAPTLPAISESTVTLTESQTGWGDKIPVIEVYVRLASPVAAAGSVKVTIQAEVEGKLIACGEAADACGPGSSG